MLLGKSLGNTSKFNTIDIPSWYSITLSGYKVGIKFDNYPLAV